MPAVPKWPTEVFENSLDGVSSAVTPELIQATQLAWGKNIINRGAKPGTRPSFKRLLTLPSGLVQGVSYFGVQGGMGVVSIAGHIYRIRIGVNDASFEEIMLPWWNSGIVKQVYMQQTVETLVIQDGQSNPILYDGSTAERSNPGTGGVPLGRQMAYGNGRLWVAINGKELVAGDIRTNVIGSELSFTETNYLSGGGTFFFPRGITGLNFIATTGTSDYGALLVFGSDYCDSLRADITFRDLWAQTPGFITSVLRHTGCASHWSLGQVNQDLYWRDSAGGIRSIRSSLADESGSGNAPISREVSRLTDYDSPQLLNFCSSISFNNRLLVTSSPRLNEVGGITWGDLIALDFAPISTMRGKSMPAYDGQWQGINFTHLFQGQFNSRSRAFAISHDDGGSNSLWEIMPDGRGPISDESAGCTDGSGFIDPLPITCTIEHGRRVFGNPTIRKRLERCDVYLWAMQGDVGLKVYWRTDNNQKWQQWDEVEVCSKDGDPEVPSETVHVWKNLLPQQRPQIKTFTIPSTIDPITKYSLITGFEFQIRLVWTGRTKIYKTVLHSTFLDDTPFAMRDVLSSACLDNDVTGNEITYSVPLDPCPFLEITQNPEDVNVDGAIFLEITSQPVSISAVIGDAPLEYRKRSGDPGLIGNDEFTDASIPPKRYRRRDLMGVAWWCHTPVEDPCNSSQGLGDSTAVKIQGSCEYDRLTTILDNQSDYGEGFGGCLTAPTTGSQLGPTCFYPPQSVWGLGGGNYTETLTRLLQTYTGNGICIQNGGNGWLTATGSLAYGLAVEDLESDAIDRFRLGTGWSSWSGSQWTADYEARTSGFVFHYQESQFRVNLSGLTPGATVILDAYVLRRIHNTGSFLPFAKATFTVVADGAGDISFDAYTPNERGFDSVVLETKYLQFT